MIKTTELRTGNLISFQGKVVIVNSLINVGNNTTQIIAKDHEGNECSGNGDFFSPIPLTPSIELGTHIMHIHQIQNLHFALKGEELDVDFKNWMPVTVRQAQGDKQNVA